MVPKLANRVRYPQAADDAASLQTIDLLEFTSPLVPAISTQYTHYSRNEKVAGKGAAATGN
eukprot:m.138477 g.138477  ORF g.138477 m.138477 type:complete len:61 (+) comp14001_c0_seq12:3051-3233(+)